MPSDAPQNHQVRPAIIWMFLAMLILGTFCLMFRLDAPRTTGDAPLPEVDRSLLVLQRGRLQYAAQPFSGYMTERYAGGSLKSRSAVSNGLLHGVSEGWHTNQMLEVREHFVNGVSHGQRIRWDGQGRKVSEAQIVGGKIEGIFQRWHDNGVLAEEVEMKNGQPEGLSRAWHLSGYLKAEVVISHGQVSKRHSYADGERREASASLVTQLRR